MEEELQLDGATILLSTAESQNGFRASITLLADQDRRQQITSKVFARASAWQREMNVKHSNAYVRCFTENRDGKPAIILEDFGWQPYESDYSQLTHWLQGRAGSAAASGFSADAAGSTTAMLLPLTG